MGNIQYLSDMLVDILEAAQAVGFNELRSDITAIVMDLLERTSPDVIINKFLEVTYPSWDILANESENEIINSCFSIFPNMPESYAKKVISLFKFVRARPQELQTSNEDLDKLQNLFKALIKISVCYVHEGRQPTCMVEGRWVYRNPGFIPVVDLDAAVSKWQVKLD